MPSTSQPILCDAMSSIGSIGSLVCIVWAVQEKMFIILNARLAETHGIGAVKPVSKSMFTKITKLDSQMG